MRPNSRTAEPVNDSPKLTRGQWMVLLAAFLGWMFDRLEMGIFPLVARPALQEMQAAAGVLDEGAQDALMVQDFPNPMLAQIPHVLLATQVETITGAGTNAMQFYPAVSAFGAAVLPDFASGGAERRSFRAFEGQGLGAA